MTVTATAKRRRRQAVQNYNHMAFVGRGIRFATQSLVRRASRTFGGLDGIVHPTWRRPPVTSLALPGVRPGRQ